MFSFFSGTDREKIQETVHALLEKEEKKGARIVRITDAHSVADLELSLQGRGLFDEKKVVVLDGLIGGENEELSTKLIVELSNIAKLKEQFYLVEGALDAATRKMIEKHADKSQKFDAAKKEARNTIFALANALKSGDKKALWIGYHRELQKGAAPEAIHGVLFWAAKDMLVYARDATTKKRAAHLIAHLAELPHEARREGFDLEYALERFALSGA